VAGIKFIVMATGHKSVSQSVARSLQSVGGKSHFVNQPVSVSQSVESAQAHIFTYITYNESGCSSQYGNLDLGTSIHFSWVDFALLCPLNLILYCSQFSHLIFLVSVSVLFFCYVFDC